MDLSQIQLFLESPNPQSRMKAITELRRHEPDVVVPLLKQRMNDSQFIIRSFVAMGLGCKRNADAYDALLEMMDRETDHNVIAEAANSLAKFGSSAVPHLIRIFEQKSHWLIRQSIFAALIELDCPDALLKLCKLGFQGEEVTVKHDAIALLTHLEDTAYEAEALEIALQAAEDPSAYIRAQAARTLSHFHTPSAQATLAKLRQDEDHRVVGATLEGLL